MHGGSARREYTQLFKKTDQESRDTERNVETFI